MNSLKFSRIRSVFAVFLGLVTGFAPGATAFTPDAESLLEALRDRIASGRGGEDAYETALEALAADPDGDCGNWGDTGPVGAEEEPALAEAWKETCPEAARPDRKDGPKALLRVAQPLRPGVEGPADAAWSLRASQGPLSGGADGIGPGWRRRWIRAGDRDLNIQAGHLGRALEATRIACVAGAPGFANSLGSGWDGPLASPYPALDGLAVGLRADRWTMQAAGSWNRMKDARASGNPNVTLRRDAGAAILGLAHGNPRRGLETRAQATWQRLETGPGPGTWLGAAGMQLACDVGDFSWRAAGAASWSPHEHGSFTDVSLGRREAGEGDSIPADGEAGWRARFRQSFSGWANPLQSPRGNTQDTLDGWAIGERGAGAAALESGFPLGGRGAYAAALRSEAGAGWAAPDTGPDRLDYGRGGLALLQDWAGFESITGTGIGWRRRGSGAAGAGGWGQSLSWSRGGWRAGVSWVRREEDYAGQRPEPVTLSLAHRSPRNRGSWSLEWSAADAESPWASQRIDARQAWTEGRWKVEQRLRVPWTPAGIAGDLSYQLALAAEL